jgi:hypothetical protein
MYNLYLSGSPGCVKYKQSSIKHKLSRKYASCREKTWWTNNEFIHTAASWNYRHAV